MEFKEQRRTGLLAAFRRLWYRARHGERRKSGRQRAHEAEALVMNAREQFRESAQELRKSVGIERTLLELRDGASDES